MNFIQINDPYDFLLSVICYKVKNNVIIKNIIIDDVNQYKISIIFEDQIYSINHSIPNEPKILVSTYTGESFYFRKEILLRILNDYDGESDLFSIDIFISALPHLIHTMERKLKVFQ
jgi:hypothetical protein